MGAARGAAAVGGTGGQGEEEALTEEYVHGRRQNSRGSLSGWLGAPAGSGLPINDVSPEKVMPLVKDGPMVYVFRH